MCEVIWKRENDLLLAWISQEYIAKRSRGLQSRNPCLMACWTVLITSPVSRPSLSRAEESSSVDGVTVTSSRNTAIP